MALYRPQEDDGWDERPPRTALAQGLSIIRQREAEQARAAREAEAHVRRAELQRERHEQRIIEKQTPSVSAVSADDASHLALVDMAREAYEEGDAEMVLSDLSRQYGAWSAEDRKVRAGEIFRSLPPHLWQYAVGRITQGETWGMFDRETQKAVIGEIGHGALMDLSEADAGLEEAAGESIMRLFRSGNMPPHEAELILGMIPDARRDGSNAGLRRRLESAYYGEMKGLESILPGRIVSDVQTGRMKAGEAFSQIMSSPELLSDAHRYIANVGYDRGMAEYGGALGADNAAALGTSYRSVYLPRLAAQVADASVGSHRMDAREAQAGDTARAMLGPQGLVGQVRGAIAESDSWMADERANERPLNAGEVSEHIRANALTGSRDQFIKNGEVHLERIRAELAARGVPYQAFDRAGLFPRLAAELDGGMDGTRTAELAAAEAAEAEELSEIREMLAVAADGVRGMDEVRAVVRSLTHGADGFGRALTAEVAVTAFNTLAPKLAMRWDGDDAGGDRMRGRVMELARALDSASGETRIVDDDDGVVRLIYNESPIIDPQTGEPVSGKGANRSISGDLSGMMEELGAARDELFGRLYDEFADIAAERSSMEQLENLERLRRTNL